jgi:hypothetical protein
MAHRTPAAVSAFPALEAGDKTQTIHRIINKPAITAIKLSPKVARMLSTSR